MDPKEFSTILSHLSSSSYKLPLLNTYFFSNNICKRSYSMAAPLQPENTSARLGGVNTLLISFLKEYEKFTAFRNQNSFICFAYTLKGQKDLNCKDIKAVLEGRKSLKSVVCLQKLNFGCSDKVYFIRLSVKGIKYAYKFFIVSGGVLSKCNESRLSTQAKSLAKLVLTVLLKSYKNPIEEISIEFILDPSKNLWIKNVKLSKDLSALAKPVDTLIISSDESAEEINEQNIPTKKLPELLKRSNTIINKRPSKILKEECKQVIKKQLTTIINNSSSEESKEETWSSDEEEREDLNSNFLEIIAREKFKLNSCKEGKIGRVTPDNEFLKKEIRKIRKTLSSCRLPVVQAQTTKCGKSRKTIPLVNIPGKCLPSIRHYSTKIEKFS